MPILKIHPADEPLELAGRLYAERKIPEASEAYELALSLGADPELGAGERWMCAMLQGQFEAAWRECDRLLAKGPAALRAVNRNRPRWEQVVWDGHPLAGKRVLVRCHHGLGDTIQFLRYLPELKRRASSVAILVQRELAPFCEGLVDHCYFDGDPDPIHEVEIEIMELAHALRLTPEQATPVPYLGVPAPRALPRGSFNVGIAWGMREGFRPERSVQPELLAPLAGIPGVAFYNLQKGAPPAEEERLRAELKFANPEGPPASITGTAELVAGLDLVISVDTMVGHLAGALGRPAWNLLMAQADWRWEWRGERSRWYPTMRLFRQTESGDWRSVIERVASELRRLAAPN